MFILLQSYIEQNLSTLREDEAFRRDLETVPRMALAAFDSVSGAGGPSLGSWGAGSSSSSSCSSNKRRRLSGSANLAAPSPPRSATMSAASLLGPGIMAGEYNSNRTANAVGLRNDLQPHHQLQHQQQLHSFLDAHDDILEIMDPAARRQTGAITTPSASASAGGNMPPPSWHLTSNGGELASLRRAVESDSQALRDHMRAWAAANDLDDLDDDSSL